MKRYMISRRRLGTSASVAALVAVVTLGCDTNVTNPGPVQDVFLDSLNAHTAIVNGTRRDLSDALDQIAYWGGAITYEINPAGSTGSFGIPTEIQAGRFDEDFSADWNRAQRARWTAENALTRFDAALPEIPGAPDAASYLPIARAALFAGYANRLLGENFCQVTFDGGTAENNRAALARAIGHFDRAESVGSAAGNAEIVSAARAGRASVRAYLATYGEDTWAAALADAQLVADTFAFAAGYSDQDQDQFNYIMFANGNEPYRAHTVWGTFYENWFTTESDPRTPWVADTANPVGDAAVTKFGGNVTWYPQEKYTSEDAPIDLSSGWEMRLIEAEAILNGAGSGDFNDAVALMNQRRTDLSMSAVSAGSAGAAYTALKQERALELWLEGRRLGDIRRWDENSVSGGITDLTDGIYDAGGVLNTTLTTLATNDRCWPIGEDERETNPGVS